MMNVRYAYHKPSEEGVAKIAALRQGFSDLQDLIDKHCPDSREAAVASTHLETAANWAIKGVVIHDAKSVVDPDSYPKGSVQDAAVVQAAPDLAVEKADGPPADLPPEAGPAGPVAVAEPTKV